MLTLTLANCPAQRPQGEGKNPLIRTCVMGNGLIAVELQVNGQAVKAEVPGDLSLMQFLRENLNLTGTKNGCSQGHCGACTVIFNGKATRSCLMKMARVHGAVVETIEGLSQGGKLHPIQQAFIDRGGVQCGFCTPGMVMSAKALLDANPDPSAEEIRAHLTKNRNTCRCTGYIKIIEAIELAAARMAGRPVPPHLATAEEDRDSHSLIAEYAVGAVTGATRYGDDIKEENMLYGKILWAAHPHAKILNIDTSEAEAMPGVAAVVTARDIPGKNQAGIVIRDQPAIAFDKVRYIGDSLAAVFAERPDIARAAVEKIRVDYEVLPGVFSPEEAARPDAPRVHEKGNLLHHATLIRGDVDAAFKECAVIAEGEYTTPFIEHGFLEPESGIAYPTDDGGVVVKIGTQTAFDDRTQLCEILALPEEKVRVIELPLGGAFGAKEDMILQQYLALGALKTKRPVKMTLSREESLRVHVKRHPAKLYYKTGADKDGRVLALKARIVLDTGCYCSLGIDVLENTVVFAAGPYYIPNLDIDGKSWYTNNVMAGAMRGFGVNQIAIALEQQFDELARKLKIDPFEFRLINGLDVGLPSASDHVMEAGVVSIKETVRAARDAFKKVKIPASNGKKIGWGVASAVKNIGFGHHIPEDAGAIVELKADGTLLLKASQHEYGQGARIGLRKLVMNELGIEADKISVMTPDTAVTPPTGPTTASRQTFLTGNAAVAACRALKDELTNHAAEILGVSPDKLQLRGSKIVDSESGKSVELKELGEKFVIERKYVMPESDQMFEAGQKSLWGTARFKSLATHICYAYNTQAAVVEVDTTTGEVKVLTIVSANDVGKILNHDAIVGQIHGGVVMGLGYALSEEFIVEKGVNLTDSFAKCRMPLANDAPEIIPVIVEVAHPQGPQGVKGFAEAPSLATAPAILNAIYDATGARIYDIPADKERVLEALRQLG